MQERLELLAAMPIFGALNEATLELLTGLAQPVERAEGEHFFREGDESRMMYVLQSGRVEIYRAWRDKLVCLRIMEAGDCFGEMALIDLFPRSASALALEDCAGLQLTAEILQELYRQDPEQYTLLQMNLGRELSRRLRRNDELLFGVMMGETLPDTIIHDLSHSA